MNKNNFKINFFTALALVGLGVCLSFLLALFAAWWNSADGLEKTNNGSVATCAFADDSGPEGQIVPEKTDIVGPAVVKLNARNHAVLIMPGIRYRIPDDIEDAVVWKLRKDADRDCVLAQKIFFETWETIDN